MQGVIFVEGFRPLALGFSFDSGQPFEGVIFIRRGFDRAGSKVNRLLEQVPVEVVDIGLGRGRVDADGVSLGVYLSGCIGRGDDKGVVRAVGRYCNAADDIPFLIGTDSGDRCPVVEFNGDRDDGGSGVRVGLNDTVLDFQRTK
jgi:hypothetical protein